MVAAARGAAERRVRHLPAARKLRFELAFEALDRFANGRPIRLLDAGCGEGLFAELVAERRPAWSVVGVDADETLLQRARASAENVGVKTVRYVRGDLTSDLGHAAYDAVAALESLEEIEDDTAALGRMAVALRRGGLLLVHVPERSWKPVFDGSEQTWRHEVRHGYGIGELRQKLEDAGVEVTRIRPTCRGTVRAAQELRDRIKTSSLKVRALAYPASAAAVRLERVGVTWGPPTALFAEGTKR